MKNINFKSLTIPRYLKRTTEEIIERIRHDKKTQISLVAIFLIGIIYTTSKLAESNKVLYVENKKPNFKSGRILGNNKASFLNSKEEQLSKTAKEILASNKILTDRINEIEEEMLAK